jgi:hypothetical protein
MNIESLTSGVSRQLLKGLTASSSTTSTANTAVSSEASIGSKSQMSKMGEVMKQLDDLASSDPAKFKTTTANIAKQLKELAAGQSGDEAARITELASKFEAASTSGSMSALRPSKPPPQGPPPQGASAYARNQASSTDASETIRNQIDSIISSAL